MKEFRVSAADLIDARGPVSAAREFYNSYAKGDQALFVKVEFPVPVNPHPEKGSKQWWFTVFPDGGVRREN